MSRLEAWSRMDGPAVAPVLDVDPAAPAPLKLAPVPVADERPHAAALQALLRCEADAEDAAYVTGVSERLNSADEPSRATALEGPWSFKAWLVGADGLADGGERPARNRLLYALFPGSFEPIAAPEEKLAIADALGRLADDDDREDVDRTLFAVRVRLEDLAERGEVSLPQGVDYYGQPLCETWDAGEPGRSATRSGLSHLDALRHKKQVVLYGPPGTGKTYEAKALADRLIRNEAIRLWGAVEYLRNRERVAELVRRQVRRRQLHQAYSYEDFVIGLRVAENGETEPYRGDLLQLIDEIRQTRVTSTDPEPLPWVLILDEINRTDLSRLLGEAFSALDDRDAQIDLPAVGGHPVDPFKLPEDLFLIGTMNTIDQSVEQLDFAMRRRFLWLHSGFRRHVIPMVVRARWEAIDIRSRPWIARHPWDALEPELERLADHALSLNRTIAESPLLGPDYEIGHTYFFDVVGFVADQPRMRSSATAPGNYLWAADGRPTPALIDLWSHALEPLLADYLSGLDGGARDALLRELESVFLASAESRCGKRQHSLTARPSRTTRGSRLVKALAVTPHAGARRRRVVLGDRCPADRTGRAGRRRLGARALRRAADAGRPLAADRAADGVGRARRLGRGRDGPARAGGCRRPRTRAARGAGLDALGPRRRRRQPPRSAGVPARRAVRRRQRARPPRRPEDRAPAGEGRVHGGERVPGTRTRQSRSRASSSRPTGC